MDLKRLTLIEIDSYYIGVSKGIQMAFGEDDPDTIRLLEIAATMRQQTLREWKSELEKSIDHGSQ